MIRIIFILSILINFIFANVNLLSNTQRTTLLDFINSNASFIKLDNGLIVRNNNYVNLDDSNLSFVDELKLSNPYLNLLIEEIGFMSSLNRLYFHEANLNNNKIPSSFYMLNINYSSKDNGAIYSRNSNESVNEFFTRLQWSRDNIEPSIDATLVDTFVKKYEVVKVDIEAKDDDGFLRNYSCDFGDNYVYPPLNASILEDNITNRVQHIYYNDGIYDINCSVRDDNNATVEEILKVYVSNTPIKSYSLYPKKENSIFKVNQDIYFEILFEDSEDFTYSWDFGDDIGSDITEKNPTYKFSDIGTYKVTCEISDSDGEIIHGFLTLIIQISDSYKDIIYGEDGLVKDIFETTEHWKERVAEFSEDIELNLVIDDYDPDTQIMNFSYDLSEYYIDDKHTENKVIPIQESKYIYEYLLDEDNVTKAKATLKAKIESNTIRLYADNFFFKGTSKECEYFTNSDLTILIDEFKKAKYENIDSHKTILNKFNLQNKNFCFELEFVDYDTEDKRLYSELILTDLNLSNQPVVIDIGSIDRGANIEHFKNAMLMETSFNIIYDEEEYRVILDENLSTIHPSIFYDDFHFIDKNISANYLNDLKNILRRGDIEYESYSKWNDRVNSFERDIILDIEQYGFNYDTVNKKLELSLNLIYLKKGIKYYELSVSNQIEARDIYDGAKAIIKLKSFLEAGLINFKIDEVKFRLNTKEYIAKDIENLTQEAKSIYLNIKKGWNLLSVPIKDNIDNLSIFGNFKAIWQYKDRNWTNPLSIDYGEGFWLNSENENNVYFYGIEYTPELNFNKNGWHISGTGQDLNVDEITNATIWVFRDEKWLSKENNTLNIIKRGEGFWIKTP